MARLSKREKNRLAKLRAFLTQRKAAAQYAKAKERFKPRKLERDSFVFIDRLGRRIGRPTSRAKGWWFYIDRGGRRHVQGKGKVPALRRQTDFDVEGQKTYHPKAVSKWERKVKFVSFGRVTPATSTKGLSSEQVGKRLTQALQRAFRLAPRDKTMRVDVIFHYGKKQSKFSFMLTSGQMKLFLEGHTDFLKNLLWNHISTEMAMDNKVSEGSRKYIKQLKRNKGKKPSQWRTNRGEPWGKHKYKIVKLTKVEFSFKRIKR
jgi:hypothetical protein